MTDILTQAQTPKAKALLKIFEELYKEELKVNKDSIFARNHVSSKTGNTIFITSKDMQDSEKRAQLLTQMRNFISDKVLRENNEDSPRDGSRTDEKIEKYISVGSTLKKAVDSIKEGLSRLKEEKCDAILTELLSDIHVIINSPLAKPKPYSARDFDISTMSPGIKKTFFQTHSISGTWKIGFFAKIIKLIREVLGTKTSSERMFDRFEEKGKELKIKLKEAKDGTEEPSNPNLIPK